MRTSIFFTESLIVFTPNFLLLCRASENKTFFMVHACSFHASLKIFSDTMQLSVPIRGFLSVPRELSSRQSTKSLRQIPFRRSFRPDTRTGNISAWNTSAAITAVNSSRSAAEVMSKPLWTSAVPAVVPLSSISTGTMVPRASTNVRSAVSCFPGRNKIW